MIIEIANSRLRRPLCYLSASLMLTLGLPMNLFAYDPSKPVEVKKDAKKAVVSRSLSVEEMDSLSGRLGNPYYAGQAKFDVVYKGVNLRTGNYSMSATDLSFEGGYGIPVNITRSYSANNIDEGPFGVGWTMSADLRSTAGGLLKSSKAPVRSVPVGMKRRPSQEIDPNIPSQPVEAVVVTDSDGKETTIQRDVDGMLTTPPWDKNEYETEYEYVTDSNGNLYWVLSSNKTMTPDGTVYQYEKKGSYINGGSQPWNNTAVAAEPNNVLKPVWVKDRHENTTNYTYGSTPVQFVKSNGTVSESPLVGVDMPNGRSMELTWSGNHVTQIRAYSSAEERKVLYGYTGNNLTSVQQVRTMSGGSPEYGRINRYGYSGGLLTSITDPRGLTTTLVYSSVMPYYGYDDGRVVVAHLIQPNGNYVYWDSAYNPGPYSYGQVKEYAGPRSTPNSDRFGLRMNMYSNNNQIQVMTEAAGDTYVTDDWEVTSTSLYKYYEAATQDLVYEQNFIDREAFWPYRNFPTTNLAVTKEYKSNFLGNPLWQRVTEPNGTASGGTTGISRVTTTETAYWGEDKYFQQKAVKVTAGSTTRYSYTDYYDNTAAQGSKGQTYKVHDNKYGGIWLDTNETVPSYGTNYVWKYQIKADPAKYSAKFEYDSKGRPTNVWKLQKDVNGTHQYVQTMSVYGSDNAPAYGNATQVTEDYGGASARTTQTLAFDLMGKAIQTQDGAGRVYSTTYDTDGNILSVDQGSQNVVAYTYGTTNGTAENGQPLTITDGLSGVTQAISYLQTGGAKGAPEVITENAGSGQTTTTTYTYDNEGDRLTSTIVTPNGTTRYKYSGYRTLEGGQQPSRAFTTINKQEFVNNAWVNGQEEVRYEMSRLGQLLRVNFALTPQSNNGSMYPNYDTVNAPLSFVSAVYDYDAGGRTLGVKHYWNQLISGNYAVEAIRGSSASYATDIGLKASTSFLTRATVGSPNWSTVRTENYGYDADFDYLTSVDYNDGLSNEVQTWDYDAAGNRVSDSAKPGTWTYDNLNRMSASPTASYTHDAVGNRLTKVAGSVTTDYQWDAVNRMTYLMPRDSYTGIRNTYRADGMRVRKVGGYRSDGNGGFIKLAVNSADIATFYDGQMPVEESERETLTQNLLKLTRNFVGARGLEAISTTQNSVTNVSYPLYDTHGNMVATLTKNTGGTSWNIGDERSYDVWGSVRSGAATGGPNGRYCANLGHVQDDESGLIYMRARYYEPESGRFVSEDSARDGDNWFIYSGNNPIKFVDPHGLAKGDTAAWALFIFGLVLGFLGMAPSLGVIAMGLGAILGYFGLVQSLKQNAAMEVMRQELEAAKRTADLLEKEGRAAEKSLASPAVLEVSRQTGQIQGALMEMALEESVEGLRIGNQFINPSWMGW
jgi:RHS repeat-associated protein